MSKRNEDLDYFNYRLNLEIYKRLSLHWEDKTEILGKVFPMLAQVKNSITLGELMRSLSQRLDLDEEMVRMEFREFKKQHTRKEKS